MDVIECDKCKKILRKRGEGKEITIYAYLGDRTNPSYYQLCNDCLKKLMEFIENR